MAMNSSMASLGGPDGDQLDVVKEIFCRAGNTSVVLSRMSRISEEHGGESGLVSIRILREVTIISRRREGENLDIAKLETRERDVPHLGSGSAA